MKDNLENLSAVFAFSAKGIDFYMVEPDGLYGYMKTAEDGELHLVVSEELEAICELTGLSYSLLRGLFVITEPKINPN